MCTNRCGSTARVRRTIFTRNYLSEHCCTYACVVHVVLTRSILVPWAEDAIRGGKRYWRDSNVSPGDFAKTPINSRNRKRLWNPYARSIDTKCDDGVAYDVGKQTKMSTRLCRATQRNNGKKIPKYPIWHSAD